MTIFTTIMASIVAGVISHVICKWLDKKQNGN